MIPLIGDTPNIWNDFLKRLDTLLAVEDFNSFTYDIKLDDGSFVTDPREPSKFMHEHHLLRLLENAVLTDEGWIDYAKLARIRQQTPEFRLISLCNRTNPQGRDPWNKISMVAFYWNRIKFVYNRELMSSSLRVSPSKA